MNVNARIVSEIDAFLHSRKREPPLGKRGGDPIILAIWKLVQPKLLNAPLARNSCIILSKTDVLEIGRTIDHEYVSHALRWYHKTTLNLLLEALKRKGYVRSFYLNIPQQIPRHVVASFDGVTPSCIRLVAKLRDIIGRRLVQVPDDKWGFSPGVFEFLLLWLSLVLSSYVLIPRLHSRLLLMKREDIRITGWIRIRGRGTPGTGSLNRHLVPLTPQTARYLKRFWRVIARISPSHVGSCQWPQELRAVLRQPKTLARAWRTLLKCLLNEEKLPRSLLRLTNLPELGRIIALMDGLPPFLVAIASEEVQVDPMTVRSFERLVLGRKQYLSSCRLVPPPRRRGQQGSQNAEPHDLFDRIEEKRKSLRRTTSRQLRLVLAKELDDLLGPRPNPPPAFSCRTDILSFNAWCYGAWVVSLLRGKDRAGTVSTRSSAIAASFFPSFESTSVSQWREVDWVLAVQRALQDHETPSAKFAYKRFYDFLVFAKLVNKQEIVWNDKVLNRTVRRNPVPLIGFDDFRHALKACMLEGVSPKLQALLRVKVILGFFAGLRSMEATQLRLRDLTTSPEPILRVRITKTEQGIRNLYLARLVPKRYLIQVLDFYHARLPDVHGNLDAAFLGTDSHPTPYDSSYLASLAGIALRRAVREPICFHHLRHAFASWMIIRLLAAANTLTLDPKVYPFATNEAFSVQALQGLRTLLFGHNPPKIGQTYTAHGLVVLCRLLGHSSPVTSLTAYCHSADILLRIFQAKKHGSGRIISLSP